VPSRGEHTVAEWLVYIQDYTQEAMHQCSRGADPAAAEAALRTIRKITAMGVACMEQCGALRVRRTRRSPARRHRRDVRRPLWRNGRSTYRHAFAGAELRFESGDSTCFVKIEDAAGPVCVNMDTGLRFRPKNKNGLASRRHHHLPGRQHQHHRARRL
jgi:hypothetical protein